MSKRFFNKMDLPRNSAYLQKTGGMNIKYKFNIMLTAGYNLKFQTGNSCIKIFKDFPIP